MEALYGLLVVAAFAVPVSLVSTALLFMGTHPETGRSGMGGEEYFDSPYQPMHILIARGASSEAIDHQIETTRTAETRAAA